MRSARALTENLLVTSLVCYARACCNVDTKTFVIQLSFIKRFVCITVIAGQFIVKFGTI